MYVVRSRLDYLLAEPSFDEPYHLPYLELFALPPEDFISLGVQKYRDAECVVLQAPISRSKFYFDLKESRLRGAVFRMAAENKSTKEYENAFTNTAAKEGKTITSTGEFIKWIRALPKSDRARIARACADQLNSTMVPTLEMMISQYQQVVPGCWITKQCEIDGWTYSKDAAPRRTAHTVSTIVEVSLNQPIPASLFHVDFKPGVPIVNVPERPGGDSAATAAGKVSPSAGRGPGSGGR